MKSTLTLTLPRVAPAAAGHVEAGQTVQPGEPPTEPTLPSSRLLRGRKSIQIEHNGALYQLRATKFGKLILTK